MDLRPIVPFEPIRTDLAPVGEQWIAQVKWDGVRVLTYYDGGPVRLYNRKLNERTMQYPELVNIQEYCSAASVVLDGEIIALEKGKPSFNKVMKRDGVRDPDNVVRARKETPVAYMVFDVLFYNGDWVTGMQLKGRQELLQKIISPNEKVQLVENFGEPKSLFEVIKSSQMEGIVCKDLTSTYAIKGKDKRWQKQKNYHDLIAVIGGVTLSGGIVNSVLLGLFDRNSQLWYIGHAGTGKLTSSDWRVLTALTKPLIIKDRLFVNKPERSKNAFWLKPVLTAKIKFIEWKEGHSLRQPSIQALVDVPPEECSFEDQR
ncbi:MAG: ATP-dependent DNA ligase [Bacillota bacterium]